MIYLYAIADRPELPLPARSGLEGAPLASLSCQDIAAVVSLFDTANVQATKARLWQHEAVVEALMAERTVLPVRFGTLLADEAATQTILAARYASFVADLARVRGRVELGLRVLWESEANQGRAGARRSQPPPAADPCQAEKNHGERSGGDGWAYMLARLEEDRQLQAQRSQAEVLAADIHAPLARLAADSTRRVLVTPRLLLTAAYLVEQGQVVAFQREVEALGTAYPDLDFLCTGPWPAYSFMTASMRTIAGEERREPCV
jgi:hypothetical protein